jgi:signal transduction histidine kinase
MIDLRRAVPPALTQARKTWRVTTAARVFVLAMATGLALSNDDLPGAGLTLLALYVLAAIVVTVEYDANVALPAIPPAEAALAALIVGMSGTTTTSEVVYLAVPPLVAGLRHGLVSTVNAVSAEVLAMLGVVVASRQLDSPPPALKLVVPWLVVGLGVGLLASWMRTSTRATEAAQAPYLSAHRLLTQLRAVSQQLPTGLDTATIAQDLVGAVRSSLGTSQVRLLVGTAQTGLVQVARAGVEQAAQPVDEEAMARTCLSTLVVQRRTIDTTDTVGGAGLPHRTVLPLRSGDHAVGVVVTETAESLDDSAVGDLVAVLDDHGLRLDTSMLFDEVRALATAEERQRIAREIHDGVAQDIASLGYLVDDLAATTDVPATRQAANQLRADLSRVVGELRLSIFDLRHDIDHASTLEYALSDYAHEVGTRSKLNVHLDLDERPARLPADVETELLRIAQEAITNARKHANAGNLWVRLSSDDSTLSMSVEDDGVGGPELRNGHYGLRIMRERAKRIGAHLSIAERPDGGTAVAVQIRHASATPKGNDDVDHSAAR